MQKNSMALFSRNTKAKKEEQEKIVAAPAVSTAEASATRSLAHVLRHARITEKASLHQAASVYTFDISARATKRDIMQAVRALYKVTPLKVAVVTIPSKKRRSMRTGKRGVKSGGRKAYVYLKKGEAIMIA